MKNFTQNISKTYTKNKNPENRSYVERIWMVTVFVINNKDHLKKNYFKTYITGTPLFQIKALLLSICEKVVQSHINPNELLLPIIFGWGGHQIRQAWCREIFNK